MDTPPTPQYIDDANASRSASERWCSAAALSVDTEFVRERTFYPRPALIQLFDGTGLDLLDPLSADAGKALRPALESPSVLKIMHAPSEDLQVFDVLCGQRPWPLFDTQIAAAFAGIGASPGYHALVQTICGVTLDKAHTRSDWLARPLTAAQRLYASEDVLYLPTLHQQLLAMLRERGFEAWCAEETAAAHRDTELYPAPRQSYQRIKGAGRLDASAQHCLRALAEWRENTAREADVPRTHIIKDGGLLALCEHPWRDEAQFRALARMHPAAWRRFGVKMYDLALDIGLGKPQRDTRAEALLAPRDTRKHADKIAALKAIVASSAEALGLPAALLATARDVEDTVLHAAGLAPASRLVSGWRAQALRMEVDDIAKL